VKFGFYFSTNPVLTPEIRETSPLATREQVYATVHLRSLFLILLAFLVDVNLHGGDRLWRNCNTELFGKVRSRTAATDVFQRLRMLLSAHAHTDC